MQRNPLQPCVRNPITHFDHRTLLLMLWKLLTVLTVAPLVWSLRIGTPAIVYYMVGRGT
jgi:hypothetical protein